MKLITIAALGLFLVNGCLTLGGCQDPDPRVDQSSFQQTTTPTDTDTMSQQEMFAQMMQSIAQMGGSVYVYNIQCPPEGKFPSDAPPDLKIGEDGVIVAGSETTDGGNDSEGIQTASGNVQIVSVHVTQGSTGVDQAGEAAPGQTGTAQATVTPTVSAELSQKLDFAIDMLMRLSSSVPISVALWGGQASAQATSSAGEGDVTPTWTSEMQSQWEWWEQTLENLGVPEDQIGDVLRMFLESGGKGAPTPEPPADG